MKSMALIKEWWPAAAAVSALAAASWFGAARWSASAAEVRSVDQLGSRLSDAAAKACAQTLSRQDASSLEQLEHETAGRIRDCEKPSMVMAALTASTRSVGAKVHAIQPVEEPAGAGAADRSRYPRQRVIVDGNYRQLADFMEACGKQSLPCRVTEFVIGRPDDAPPGSDVLRATIVVESYRPARPPEEGGPPSS